jgi:hypothetical protein
VRHRERGDRPDEPPIEADEEQQREHEQQMVEAAQDMFDAEDAVRAGDLADTAAVVGGAVQAGCRLSRRQRVYAALAVAPVDFDERRRVEVADPADLERAA